MFKRYFTLFAGLAVLSSSLGCCCLSRPYGGNNCGCGPTGYGAGYGAGFAPQGGGCGPGGCNPYQGAMLPGVDQSAMIMTPQVSQIAPMQTMPSGAPMTAQAMGPSMMPVSYPSTASAHGSLPTF